MSTAERTDRGSDPDPSGRPPSLLAYPTYLLVQVNKALQRLLATAFAEHDLTPSHFGVLAAVSEGGASTQQQLADALDLDKSHMVGFLDHLERRGLVERRRDARDRRCHRIGITPAGERLLGVLHEVDRAVQRDAFGALSPRQVDQLASLLTRVLADHDSRRLDARAGDVSP